MLIDSKVGMMVVWQTEKTVIRAVVKAEMPPLPVWINDALTSILDMTWN